MHIVPQNSLSPTMTIQLFSFVFLVCVSPLQEVNNQLINASPLKAQGVSWKRGRNMLRVQRSGRTGKKVSSGHDGIPAFMKSQQLRLSYKVKVVFIHWLQIDTLDISQLA